MRAIDHASSLTMLRLTISRKSRTANSSTTTERAMGPYSCRGTLLHGGVRVSASRLLVVNLCPYAHSASSIGTMKQMMQQLFRHRATSRRRFLQGCGRTCAPKAPETLGEQPTSPGSTVGCHGEAKTWQTQPAYYAGQWSVSTIAFCRDGIPQRDRVRDVAGKLGDEPCKRARHELRRDEEAGSSSLASKSNSGHLKCRAMQIGKAPINSASPHACAHP